MEVRRFAFREMGRMITSVRTVGANAAVLNGPIGNLPTSEIITWTWNGSPTTFDVYRSTSPAGTSTLLPAGKYHLLAAIADSAGNLTPITAEDSTFRVTGSSQVAVPAISRTPMRFNWAFTRASHVVEQWI